MTQQPSRRADGTLSMKLMGRLKPGVSIEQARMELRALDGARIDEIAAGSGDPLWRQVQITVEPAAAGFSTLRDRFATPMLVLMAVVSLLLLLACTNLASLLLARAAARQREMAIRVALGAGRLRLARQVLTESLLLSAAGSVLGVMVAYAGAGVLVRIHVSGRALIGMTGPLEIQVTPDVRVLSFTAGLGMLAGLLFGAAPAWHACGGAPAPLRESGPAADTRSRRRFGRLLVVAQVALSLVLVSAAALFAGHLSDLRTIGVGFDRRSVLLVAVNPEGGGLSRRELAPRYQELLARFEAIPGVRSATLSAMTPISGAGAARFVDVPGVRQEADRRRYISLNFIAPGYFQTFGTPLLAGRDFEARDESGARVAIVNEARTFTILRLRRSSSPGPARPHRRAGWPPPSLSRANDVSRCGYFFASSS